MIDKKINSAKRWLGLLVAILVAMMLFTFTGCNSEKKLTAKAEMFMSKYPKKALPVFRDKYPCILTKADTTIFLSDTTFLVDCPDTIPAAEYFTLHDTTVKNVYYPGKTIKVPVTLPQKVVTIVQRWEDSSKVKEIDIKLKEANNEIKKLEDKLTWWKWCSLWMIALGFSLRYIYRGIKYIIVKTALPI